MRFEISRPYDVNDILKIDDVARHALGFHNAKMPCAHTFANLVRKLAPNRLGAWIRDNDHVPNAPIAIAGKVLHSS